MSLKKIVILLCFSLFSSQIVIATQENEHVIEDADIAQILEENGVQGTVIISSLDNKTTYVHNHQRALERLSPASTFKIMNSIIALETGVIADQHEIIKWDGQKRDLETWNQDQNLKSAFKFSCIWFYQELAKKIGIETYLDYFNRLNYGNKLVGTDVTTFWLKDGGDLRISPYEQIEFLRQIYQHQLPITERTYEILKDIMLEEATDNYKIYSKTGAATKDWIGHGWYVGYITTNDQVWIFATNILIDGLKDLPKRKAITMASLKKKGIIS
jgi:beta-lactamase class D